MLMRSELPNWLLLRALGAENPPPATSVTNLYPQPFFSLLAIPQAFPQRSHDPQLESSKVLTQQNYRDFCIPLPASRTRKITPHAMPSGALPSGYGDALSVQILLRSAAVHFRVPDYAPGIVISLCSALIGL